MKNILIIFFMATVLNAQALELMFDNDLPELNSNLNFTVWNYTNQISSTELNLTNWTGYQGGTITNSTTIAGDADGTFGAYKSGLFNAADLLYIKFHGSISAGTIELKETSTGTIFFTSFTDGVKQTANNGFTILNSSNPSGTITLSELWAAVPVAPTGFTSPTMNATNYVVEGAGCKFVEATGTTYIETSAALKKGTRRFKVTQDWTQGRLSISNGTISVNLNQSDGTQTVSLYFDGTQKLKIECTNNTTSIISYLSIK